LRRSLKFAVNDPRRGFDVLKFPHSIFAFS
jgi:hypothetical protein